MIAERFPRVSGAEVERVTTEVVARFGGERDPALEYARRAYQEEAQYSAFVGREYRPNHASRLDAWAKVVAALA